MPAEWAPHCPRRGSPGRITRKTGRTSSSPIPWVYCEIVRHLSQVDDREYPRQRRSRREACDLDAWPPGREPRNGALPPLAHRPRVAARLRPHLREERQGRCVDYGLVLQRVGQVRQLAQRRPHPAACEHAVRDEVRRTACEAGERQAASRGAGRRKHRRERRRPDADDRRVAC